MTLAITEAKKNGHKHYVYGLCRGDTKELFYIGKGVGDRAFAHEANSSLSKSGNPHKNAIIKKHGVGGYVFFSSSESSKDAFNSEKDLIAKVGLKNLANIGRGGEGQDPEFASEFAKKQWADTDSNIRKATKTDEYKKRNIEALKLTRTPQAIEKRKASMEKVMPKIAEKLREHFKSYEARKAAGNGSRGRVQSDLERANRSAVVSVAWSNDELKKAQSERLKKISSTPEMREKRSLAAKARWAKPGAKEKHLAELKKRSQTPEVIKKISESAKRNWEDPAFREKCIKNLKRKPIC